MAASSDNDMAAVEKDVDRELRVVGWCILGLIVVCGVAMLFAYDKSFADDPETGAQTKAQEFVEALDAKGLQTPDADAVARTYGVDGGRACTFHEGDVQFALTLLNQRGTGEVNGRSALLDPRAVEFQRTMMETYCPKRLEEFEERVDDLRFERSRPER